MSNNIRHLNVHIPMELDTQIKEICKHRKEKGLANATMRIVVIELLEKALEVLKERESELKILS